MYNTKPSMYQILLGISIDCPAHEIEHHASDNTFVFTVTLESVQEKFRQKFALSKKTSTPGITIDYTFTKKAFPKQFKRDYSLCGKQGYKSV
jgi:hypothetical protein